ncbi:hypothetical protein [Candidatus Albibeggiatoa sp. nov. BB20]|uniref:hypothetical protein n=1 Tax=Candidatus Albibeggiatoa sp. nov. BB20 TaxID=3162723 RepID=UPI00336532B1
MTNLQPPLTNLQLELLKLYSLGISEKQLYDIKSLIGNYFAEQATQAMDEFWDENKLTGQDMEDWANGHDRIKNSA